MGMAAEMQVAGRVGCKVLPHTRGSNPGRTGTLAKSIKVFPKVLREA